ncbi:hypothetical protein C8J56DRAFT_182783 [Mycena floridula]|nr:hypothetical protein C8J56DRAFT_182783 [Mycena floridula]
MDGSIEVKKEDKKPFIKVEFKVEAKTEQEALGCSLKKEEELEEKKAVSKILIECPRTVSVQLPANSESDRWQDSVPFVEMEVDVQLPVKKEEGERKPITTSLNRIPELYPEVDRDSNRISVAPPSRQVSPEIDLPMLDQMPIEAPVMDVEMQSTSDPSEEEARPARAGSEPVIIQQRSALPPHLIHKPKAEFQGIDLWPELRLKHTEGIPRVDLPDGAEEGVKKTLKRIFFAETYGGSFVETIPTISEKRLRHHNHPHWLFMTDDLHPFGPAAPGEPGIWFSIAQSPLAPDEDDDEPILVLDDSDDGEEKLNDKETVIYHTFRGLSGKESGEWLYLGEYTRTRLPNMFLSEYQTLHPNVRRCWGEGIRKGEWGRDVRIAVHHRKTNEGRNPTRAQYDVLADANETYQHHVSAEEIAQAYWNGEEVCRLWSQIIFTDAVSDYDHVSTHPQRIQSRLSS